MSKIKIAIFTDDFQIISAHPGRATSLLICEILKDCTVNFSKIKINHGLKKFDEDNYNQSLERHCKRFAGKSFIEAPGAFFNCDYAINLRDCNIVIIRNAGGRFLEKMKSAGIKVIITDTMDITQAVYEIFNIKIAVPI